MIRYEGGPRPYVIRSEKGKRLGRFKTKEEAEHRLAQIEYFKHRKAKGGKR